MGKTMGKTVITYGTFDLLHYGHILLLKRARALGDRLIVGLSTDEFNEHEKGKHAYLTYDQRKELLLSIRYVDDIIPEESWEQKRTDIDKYDLDVIVMGDDWKGNFDDLKDLGVDVVYVPRTPGISSGKIRGFLDETGGI
ncbi:MAG: glycerol-3-phosphate cytidylyltransferase [Oscillospiraceae bacterium]|nr:glycerol-3-phosphate cytidylyltransferase [Oscillospiraceae bacterium]